MAGADRKRQKKLEQSRKKRDLLKKQARERERQFQGKGLLRAAQAAPFGPAWISTALDETDPDELPALLTAVITRKVRGLLLAEMMVVDRTCLGIKNAMVTRLMAESDLLNLIGDMSVGADPLRPCEPLEAQSVVFHALDYAASLGFGAHEDFEAAVLEPRPATLLETPLAKPPVPIYISGPDDDVGLILRRLDERVGPANYRFMTGFGHRDDLLGSLGLDLGEEEDEAGDEENDGDDFAASVIETTGEPSEA